MNAEVEEKYAPKKSHSEANTEWKLISERPRQSINMHTLFAISCVLELHGMKRKNTSRTLHAEKGRNLGNKSRSAHRMQPSSIITLTLLLLIHYFARSWVVEVEGY